jgi:type IV pilus assembly protein PilY1
MKNLITSYRSIATTATLTLWCCLAQADDIEIYRGTQSSVKPVSMMVIDTSRSMSYWAQEQWPDYVPATDYKAVYPTDPDGNNIDYLDQDLYYFNDDNYSGDELSSSDLTSLRQHPFPIAALKCDAAQSSIQSEGFYADNFKRWNPSTLVWDPSLSYQESYRTWWGGTRYRWVTPDTPLGEDSNFAAIVDCKADETDSANKYIKADPSRNSQYLSYKDGEYSDAWRNYFPYIYSGNYLNYLVYRVEYKDTLIGAKKSRMQITKDAAKFVVETTGGIKLGLARFDLDSDGGMIDLAATDIERLRDLNGTDTVFNTMIDSYLPWGGTPLTESFYEAARYLRGDSVLYGTNSTSRRLKSGYTLNDLSRDSSSGILVAENYNYNRTTVVNNPSVSASRVGNTYNSPIDSACNATSNLVLFTDGVPQSDEGANSRIHTLLSDANINFRTEPGLNAYDLTVLSNSCSGNGGCAEELAYYLANVDQRPLLAGKQTINTHVIGGFFDESSSGNTLQYIENIARYGQGTYAAASSKEDIAKAFRTAVTAGHDKPVTFVAPAVSVNSYNSLEHLDSLFYAMFVPATDNNWKGNLKSYRLAPNGTVVDAEGDSAIDLSSGRFKEASRSYWTNEGTTDGDSVLKGGAAANLTKEHNILTHLSGTKSALDTAISTSTISKNILGLSNLATGEEHTALIDWLNRKEGENTRLQIEDPLHSRPVVVNYGYDKDESTGTVTAKGVVFMGTNSGYLHAIDADKQNFKEYFSYIPKELLENANLYHTADLYEPKPYGVDGPINYWHADANQNAQVDNGEKVYLYFGLRRGGRHYYALDISNPEIPKFLWQINGGQGGDFDKMGESWSPMSLAKVRWGDSGKTKVVLLFGGGYDAQEDNRATRTPHDMGNSVYMIDPETGKLLWSASDSGASTTLTDMTSAITSEIKTIDYDGDQVTDYFFVSDIGGRVWRFDLNADITTPISKTNFIAGAGVIFDANKNNTSYQRFYDAPSVSYFSDKETHEKFLTVSIGSGFRAHPLQVAGQDSFYIIKDHNIKTPTVTYRTLDRSDLLDLATTSAASTYSLDGWKHDLTAGEKVLSPSLTANGHMFFTTFSPKTLGAGSSGCNADIGKAKAYTIAFNPSAPTISSEIIITDGPPPAPIELTISPLGQKAFCEKHPSHESCIEEGEDPDCKDRGDCPKPPPDCESSISVILSGTSIIAGGSDQCELLKRNFWRSL